MTSLEIAGVVFSILGVYFTIQKKIIAWYMNIVASVLYSYLFYENGLFADAELQVFFVGSSIYGIIQWQKETGEWISKRSSKNELLVGLLLTILSGVLIGFFHQKMSSSVSFPYLDALLTAGSIWSTYLAAKQKIENWICWMVIDVAYSLVYLSKGLYLTAGLYLLFVILAWRGWRQWSK